MIKFLLLIKRFNLKAIHSSKKFNKKFSKIYDVLKLNLVWMLKMYNTAVTGPAIAKTHIITVLANIIIITKTSKSMKKLKM